MKQKAVHDYVKKKRGLYAADGGEVPDDEEEVPEEAAAEAPEVDDTAEDEGQETDDETPVPASAPDKQAQIRDYLASKYDTAADDSGVKAAVQEQKRQNMIANVGEGLHDMITARATANGAAPDNGKFFQGIRDQGQQGVQQAVAARQQNIQGFLQKNQMDRQVAQDMMAKGSYEQKQQAAKFLRDQSDPASEYSKSKIATFKQLHGDALGPGFDYSKVSAADIPKLVSDLHQKAALATSEKNVQAKIDSNKEIAKGRETAHADAVALVNQRKSEAADSKTEQKTADGQRKSFLEMENKGMGGRGAPQYVSKNMVTQQSIANAQKMLDGAPKDPVTGKPDYNKLNDKQIHLFNGELEKIATNGSPTESGRNAMEADTLASAWAKFQQKVGGKPTGAQVGEFVEQNAEYLRGLKESVDSSVNKFRRENFDNYYTAGAISDEHADKYKQKHPELFPEERPEHPAAPAQGGPGVAATPPQDPVAALEAEMAKRNLKPKNKVAVGAAK